MSLIFTPIKRLTTVIFTAGCLALSACDSTVLTCQSDCTVDEPTENPLPNLIDTATTDGRFRELLSALEATGLDQILADDTQSFTVFAPTDAAFAAIASETMDALIADNDALTDTLLYHVLPGSVDAATAIGLAGTDIVMQNNKLASLTLDGDTLLVNNAIIEQTDIVTSNGIIHVINAVLTPPTETTPAHLVQTAISDGNFTTLVSALQQSGLDQVLADSAAQYTLFAPTDAAFEALGDDTVNALLADAEALNSTLLYHVLPDLVDAQTAISFAGNTVTMQNGSTAQLSLNGDTLKINNARVTTTDIIATNGIIHAIDAVLIPANVDITPTHVDLIATLQGLPNYSTLLAHLQSTGLDATLSDAAKTHTIFAPDNAAFAAADAAIQAVVADDASVLESALLGHVLSDSVVPVATAITLDSTSITMANGTDRTISVSGTTVSIDGATVTETDIEATNGIIHGIDRVLLD